MPSLSGVTNMIVVLAPGASAPTFACGMSSTVKSWGLVPALVILNVTLARFSVLKIVCEYAVSSTETSKL